jgi:hypothetical protein
LERNSSILGLASHMSVGVETNGLREMSFKSIGTLAGTVLKQAELAARSHNGAHKFRGEPSGVAQLPDASTADGMEMGGGPTKGGERQPALPVEGRPGKLNGKGRGTVKATASVRGGAEQLRGGTAKAPETAYGHRMKPVLRLVSNRCLDTATPAANKGRSPRPVVSRHLVLIGGTHYASSGMR